MTVYAGTQQSVFSPDVVYPGDRIGLAQTWLPDYGYIAADNINIASGCFGVYGTDTVSQGNSGSQPFAGIVLRNQASVIPYGDTSVGYGFAVAEGYKVSVCRSGNIAVVISNSYNVGGVINNGDAVYVSNTDGSLVVGGASVPVGYTQTDFIVVDNAIVNNYSYNLVAISNQNQFLGNI